MNAAKANGCSMRIGVNAGSLERDLLEKYGEPCPEALVESALDHIRILEDHDFRDYKVAVKASDVFLAVAAYHQLADAVDCPLHLGITEAGALRAGTVKSAIGIGALLGRVGDTIRVRARPSRGNSPRRFEIRNASHRNRGVRVVSARLLAPGLRLHPHVESWKSVCSNPHPVSLSVLGCVVNGPGDALETDLGITARPGNICLFVRVTTTPSRTRHDRSHRLLSRPRRRRSRLPTALSPTPRNEPHQDRHPGLMIGLAVPRQRESWDPENCLIDFGGSVFMIRLRGKDWDGREAARPGSRSGRNARHRLLLGVISVLKHLSIASSPTTRCSGG